MHIKSLAQQGRSLGYVCITASIIRMLGCRLLGQILNGGLWPSARIPALHLIAAVGLSGWQPLGSDQIGPFPARSGRRANRAKAAVQNYWHMTKKLNHWHHRFVIYGAPRIIDSYSSAYISEPMGCPNCLRFLGDPFQVYTAITQSNLRGSTWNHRGSYG